MRFTVMGAGADALYGLADTDAYFVDNAGDVVIENANEGNDTVFSTAHLRLTENVEYLVLQGSADLQGYGNSSSNVLYGDTGSNILNGGAAADMLTRRRQRRLHIRQRASGYRGFVDHS